MLPGEGLVRQPLYLADDLHGPLAGEGEVHPGTVGAHLTSRYLRSEPPPYHAGEDVQGRVVAHVRVSPIPVQLSAQFHDGLRDGVIEDVDDTVSLAPRVHHPSADRTDAKSTVVRRLAPAARVEGGPVQDHLPAGESRHPGVELAEIGVAK